MGSFDQLAQDLSKSIIEIFVTNPTTFERVEEVYNEDTGKSTKIREEVSVLASPPVGFAYNEIGGSVLAQDMRMYVAAKSLGEFDPVPTSNVQVLITVGVRKFKVIRSMPIYGGDEVALYDLQLRL